MVLHGVAVNPCYARLLACASGNMSCQYNVGWLSHWNHPEHTIPEIIQWKVMTSLGFEEPSKILKKVKRHIRYNSQISTPKKNTFPHPTFVGQICKNPKSHQVIQPVQPSFDQEIHKATGHGDSPRQNPELSVAWILHGEDDLGQGLPGRLGRAKILFLGTQVGKAMKGQRWGKNGGCIGKSYTNHQIIEIYWNMKEIWARLQTETLKNR